MIALVGVACNKWHRREIYALVSPFDQCIHTTQPLVLYMSRSFLNTVQVGILHGHESMLGHPIISYIPRLYVLPAVL